MTSAEKPGSKLKFLIVFVFSLAVAAAGTAGYVWTEHQAKARYDAYMLGAGKYKKIDPTQYDGGMQGQPIYFSVQTSSGETLKDTVLGATAENAIALLRTTSMFQWVEYIKAEKKAAYKMEWKPERQDSEAFLILDRQYRNPDKMFEDELFFGKKPFLGVYKVAPADIKRHLGIAFQHHPLKDSYLALFPADWKERVSIKEGNLHILPLGAGSSRLGEMRVAYQVLPEGVTITIAGVQNGIAITPVDKVALGEKTIDALFDNPQKGMEKDIWLYRAAAAAVVLLGFLGMFFMLRHLSITAGMLYGWGNVSAALLLWVLVCAQISRHFWPGLHDVAHQLNVVSAISGSLLLAHVLIAFLRAFKNRRKQKMATPAAVSSVAPPPAPEPASPVPPPVALPKHDAK